MRRPARIVSLFLLIAIANVYVFASGGVSGKAANDNSPKVLFGKLVTVSNRPILVNGGEAITGTTILSGSQLQTLPALGASVQLETLGSVMIAPASTVLLTFDAKNVTVKVAAGNATLTTAKGVKGTVLGPNGEVTNAPTAPAPTDADTARNWGIAGVAVGSAAFVWALIAWNRANDAQDQADALAAQLAALRACLAGQSASPVRVCTSF